jgi:5-methylcytosine-specific restriction endonuclease McrA
LRDHLTAANHADLLRQASGKSKRAIEALVAERFPKPDAASAIRKLPQREPQAPGEQPALTLEETLARPAASVASQAGEPWSKAAQPARESRVQPLSAARYKVQFTASNELKNKLERACRLLSHSNPSGDLAVLVERAVDLLLGELEKTKLGKTERPRRPRARQPGAISRAVRREVFERDGEQCSFVSVDGRRCEARAFIELDHVQARARGGSGASHNIRVLCRQHNKLRAEQTFGRENIERKIHMRQR